jgi:hypothetical protein
MSHKKSTFLVYGISAALALMVIGILGSCHNSLGTNVPLDEVEARSLSATVPQAWPMGNVAGTWLSAGYGEQFLINNSTLTYGYDFGSGFFTVYKGNIVQATNTSATTGYIYIQYTNALDPSWNGNFYAVYWSNFDTSVTPNTISFSGCSDGPGKATLAEAIAEYTYANGYFSGSSNFVRNGPPPPVTSISMTVTGTSPGLPPTTVTGNSSGVKPPIVLLLEQQAGITTQTE